MLKCSFPLFYPDARVSATSQTEKPSIKELLLFPDILWSSVRLHQDGLVEIERKYVPSKMFS
jgi:hypothetical protein